jgi:hypothetical protein
MRLQLHAVRVDPGIKCRVQYRQPRLPKDLFLTLLTLPHSTYCKSRGCQQGLVADRGMEVD